MRTRIKMVPLAVATVLSLGAMMFAAQPANAATAGPAVVSSTVSTKTLMSSDGRTPLMVTTRSTVVRLGTSHGVTHYQKTLVTSASLVTTLGSKRANVSPMSNANNCLDDSTYSAQSCITMDYVQQTSGGRTYTEVDYYSYKWLRLQSGLTFTSASGLAGVFGQVLNSSRFDQTTNTKSIGTPVVGTSYTQYLPWGSDFVATDGTGFQCANSTVTLHHGSSSWKYTREDLGVGDCSL